MISSSTLQRRDVNSSKKVNPIIRNGTCLSPLKQIRKACLECMGNSRKSVRFCPNTECHFWYLRFGMSPKRAINENGEHYQELFNPNNFKDGAKYSPDKEVSSFRL